MNEPNEGNPLSAKRFANRRALEALRSGVPNQDAVAVLGCNQPVAEGRFHDLLAKISDDEGPPASGLGMLVQGDFGSGKSHFLEYLEHEALSNNFVCSRVIFSKETPLFNLGKIFQSAIENTQIPRGATGQLMEVLGGTIDTNSKLYRDFFLWANTEGNGLNGIFPATLAVHENIGGEYALDIQNDIRWFWSGEKMSVARVKEGLREIRQQANYSFKAPTQRDLPVQRLRFALELIKAAGYKGWVILLDEVELTASYTLLQRAKSYAELARLMGRASDEPYPGMVVAATVASDYVARIIGEKGDREYAGERLRSRGEDAMAARAETGMRVIEREGIALDEPTNDDVQSMVDKLREIYSVAYDWDAPQINRKITGAQYERRMRYQVRAAINEWDLLRLYPNSKPETEGTEFTHGYYEDAALEQDTQDDSVEAEES